MSGNDERHVIREKFYVVGWGWRYHKKTCHLVKNTRPDNLNECDADLVRRWGLRPCGSCKPKPKWAK